MKIKLKSAALAAAALTVMLCFTGCVKKCENCGSWKLENDGEKVFGKFYCDDCLYAGLDDTMTDLFGE